MEKTLRFLGFVVIMVMIGLAFTACREPAEPDLPEPPVITINTQPMAETTVTEGSISGSLSVSASVTQGATLSYQWFSNETASNIGGTAINGATRVSFTIPTNLTEGRYYYFVEVRANGADSTRSNAAIVNVAPPAPPTITTTSLGAGRVGVTYNATLAAEGTRPITWEIVDGNLPRGLNLSGAGVISGSPVNAGTFNFTVKAENTLGYDLRDFSIQVNHHHVRGGRNFNVSNEDEWFAAVRDINAAGSNMAHTITVTSDFSLREPWAWEGQLYGHFLIFTQPYLTVTIQGNKTISLEFSRYPALLNIGITQNIILQDIGLKGMLSDPVVSVEGYYGGGFPFFAGPWSRREGTFTMRGNASVHSGGVLVNGGVFTMHDNTSVHGNTASAHRSGVSVRAHALRNLYVAAEGVFTMYDNASVHSNYVGGVSVVGGVFTMHDNTSVRDNRGAVSGVRVQSSRDGPQVTTSTFTMHDNASVYNNISSGSNSVGGVSVLGGVFTMHDNASVYNNISSGSNSVGGVRVAEAFAIRHGEFRISGGTISTNNTSPTLTITSVNEIAQYGTVNNAGVFVSNGHLPRSHYETIKVRNGIWEQ